MSEWQRAQVEINQHHISYLRTGGEKPPIILLHDFTEDSSTWQEVATALAANYDLIMPDTIGHGESSRLPADGAIDPLQDLTRFIEALGLQKTALLGHSMGAALAAEFTAQNPEKVAVLVLEEVPWFDPASTSENPQQALGANDSTAIKNHRGRIYRKPYPTVKSIIQLGMKLRTTLGQAQKSDSMPNGSRQAGNHKPTGKKLQRRLLAQP